MFKCKICLEKDKRIADLHDEIFNLRKLVFPHDTAYKIPANQFEADQILSGNQDIAVFEKPSDEELEKAAEVVAEQDRLLSGNY